MNFYEVLNVKTDANDKEIKKAYRVLAKKYHPDTYQGNKELAENKMQQINVAYDTLSNPDLRSKYDRDNGINLEETINNIKQDFYRTSDYNDKKHGVTYNVRYKANTNNVKYNKYGYAEANYYHAKHDEEEVYKSKPLSTLFKGEQLKYTLFFGVLAIVVVIILLSMSIKSINQIIDSTKAVANQINATNSYNDTSHTGNGVDDIVVYDYSTSTEAINNYWNNLKDELNNKKEEFIEKSSEKEKRNALNSLGITNPEDQKAVLEFISGL